MRKAMIPDRGAWLAGLAVLAFAVPPLATAAEKQVRLGAVEMTRNILGRQVTFWVFDDLDQPGILARGAPGPQISLGKDQSLAVYLENHLSEPTSIVIAGQAPAEVTHPGVGVLGSDVTRTADGRVRSLTLETPPFDPGNPDPNHNVRIYRWNTVRPGTFLYHSGSHMTVQVQMGLYGALAKNFDRLTAYPGHGYGTQATLLLSEVDPDLHDAVANGTYGTDALPTTLDYRPRFFLLNGLLYNALEADGLPAPFKRVDATNNPDAEPILIRVLNAGLSTRAPTLLGSHFRVIAEDGNPYPYPLEQCSVLLPALGTKDLLVDVARVPVYGDPGGKTGDILNGKYPVFDRRLFRSSGGGINGGLIGYLEISY